MKLTAEKSVFQIPQAEKYLHALLPRLQEKRAQSFTTIILTLITLSFFGIFAISPTLSTIADLQKQISDSQFVNQQLRQKIINLSQLETSYKSIQKDLPVIFAAVPINPDVTVLVGQLQTLVQNSGVALLHIQTLPVDVSTHTTAQNSSFVFAVDVSGTYQHCKSFLDAITNFNRLVTIDAVSLTRPSATEDLYNLSLRGNAYFLSQQ